MQASLLSCRLTCHDNVTNVGCTTAGVYTVSHTSVNRVCRVTDRHADRQTDRRLDVAIPHCALSRSKKVDNSSRHLITTKQKVDQQHFNYQSDANLKIFRKKSMLDDNNSVMARPLIQRFLRLPAQYPTREQFQM